MKTHPALLANLWNVSGRFNLLALGLMAGLLASFDTRLMAQTVATEPSGFYQISCPGNSDTIVSIPFTRPIAASGLVLTASGNSVQATGVPGWSANQFVYASPTQTNTYFLLVRSGPKEGYAYTITANTSDTLTLDLSNADLSGVSAGHRFAIVPYWTLGSVFPGGAGVNPSPSPGSRSTEILLPDLSSAGINLSPVKTYYFHGGFWKQFGQGAANKNDDVLLSDSYFTVRHNVSTATTIVAQGNVLTTKWTVPLATQASVKQDNAVAIPRPVAVALIDSNLISSGGFSVSPSPGNRTDELLVFDSTVIGKNKSPSATYYYWNNAWRKFGAGATDVGTDQVFTPGTGVIIRKGASVSSTVWVNSPTY